MKKNKHNLRKDSRLLVEHILNKDPLAANSVFKKLILEAEDNYEADAFEEFDFDDGEGEEVADTEMDFGGEGDIAVMDNAETDSIVDDTIEIDCQINAKMISNLFDKIAQLKNNLSGLNLDEKSREYLKYDITIQYYSDKLQDLQNKTNPGIDQGKVETAITKIEEGLNQLEGEISGGTAESELTDIETPEEVAASNDLGDEGESEEGDDFEDIPTDEGEPETPEDSGEELNGDESEGDESEDFEEI